MYMIQILKTLIYDGHKWIDRFHLKCSKPISHPAHTFEMVAGTIFSKIL